MSSARKRRAELSPNPPPPGAPKLTPAFPSSSSAAAAQRAAAAAGPNGSSLMSLQQIINITDKRLSALEAMIAQGNFKGSAAPTAPAGGASSVAAGPSITPAAVAEAATAAAKEATAQIQENVDELLHRFDILLGELAELKDTVMKLQTYTIEVNHVLIQDKIRAGQINGENIPELPVSSTEADSAEQEAQEETQEEVSAPATIPKEAAHPSRRSRASKNA